MINVPNTTGNKTLKFFLYGMAILVVGQLIFANKTFADCGSGTFLDKAGSCSGCGTANCSGLVSYWKFDDADLIATDSKGSNNGGLQKKVSTTWVPGKKNNALNFDGSSDLVRVPNNSSLNLLSGSFTISTWIKMDTCSSALRTIMQKTDVPGDGSGFTYWLGGAGIPFGKLQSNTTAYSTAIGTENFTPVTCSAWNHLVWSGDIAGDIQNIQKLYMNGVRKFPSQNLTSFASMTFTATTHDLLIGTGYGSDGNTWNFYKGSMDELTIWNRALSDTEVGDLYKFGSCGNGTTDTGEACDDGNTISGDGCSASCTVEQATPIASVTLINKDVNIKTLTTNFTPTPTCTTTGGGVDPITKKFVPLKKSCTCPTGWTSDIGGTVCTDTNACTNNPCSSGYTCADVKAPAPDDSSGRTCAKKACPALVDPANGTVAPKSGVFGDTATYACGSGYEIAGSATATCQADTAWTAAPTCAKKACPALVDPANGTVAPKSGVFGDTATYACGSGYEFAGSATATCQADTAWTAAPTCADINECVRVVLNCEWDDEREIDVCTDNTVSTNICGSNSACTNTPAGTNTCTCNTGYSSANGKNCTLTQVCGNSTKEGTETCDDGKQCQDSTPCTTNTNCVGHFTTDNLCSIRGNDGCSTTCATEPGWACLTDGAACACTNLTKPFSTEDAINYLDLITSGLTPTSVELVYFDTNCDKVLDSSDGINIYDSQT